MVWRMGVIVVTFVVHGGGGGVLKAAEVVWVLAVPVIIGVVFEPADVI
jgi:hypothetical protein